MWVDLIATELRSILVPSCLVRPSQTHQHQLLAVPFIPAASFSTQSQYRASSGPRVGPVWSGTFVEPICSTQSQLGPNPLGPVCYGSRIRPVCPTLRWIAVSSGPYRSRLVWSWRLCRLVSPAGPVRSAVRPRGRRQCPVTRPNGGAAIDGAPGTGGGNPTLPPAPQEWPGQTG